MSKKIGVNDLCPCGSGKKYKKCCFSSESMAANLAAISDVKWHKLRQLEGIIVDKHLLAYVAKELPNNIIKLAWEDLLLSDFPKDAEEGLLNQFFIPWFLFNWISSYDIESKNFDDNKTIAQNYLDSHKNRLSAQESVFMEAMTRSYFSFYCVLEVEVEKSMLIKDILLGTTHTIKERMGTRQLKRGDVIFSRILTVEDQSIFVGMAPFPIPASYHHEIIDFREKLMADGNVLSSTTLREDVYPILLDYFFKIVSEVFDPSPIMLINSDNDLIALTKYYFELTIDPEDALALILPMALDRDLDDILEEADIDKFGQKKISFSWLKKNNKFNKTWENTILGNIEIKRGTLTLDTNSQERAELGKKLLIAYLGDKICFQKSSVKPYNDGIDSNPSERQLARTRIVDSTECRKSPTIEAKDYWKNWLNEPIIALKNNSPLQAAKTKEGRERLEALLLQYERDFENKKDFYNIDLQFLRKKLRL
ncbi:MAG: SEC-C domain-containing protein [Holosporaceae bacterium]|jgi:hypothetical protein|nr:SEC-C domain-containing protein [Holosporaceae bacterium]